MTGHIVQCMATGQGTRRDGLHAVFTRLVAQLGCFAGV